MKTDHAIRIDRRRVAEPAGGRWAALEADTQGRVLVLAARDVGQQAVALVARLRELRCLADTPEGWEGFAVLARNHSVLEPIRALCEAEGIPLSWTGELPQLHRIREIAAFCYETLAEQRRDRRVGNGVLLATLHGAKGLEFPHVLIADGGWHRKSADDTGSAMEEERRLFYVGMTRARETLTLGGLTGGPQANPQIGLMDGDWLLRREPRIEPPEPGILACRYTRFGPADLDLGYAGGYSEDAPIHAYLAAVGNDDLLGSRAERGRCLLLDSYGHPIARLSKRAADRWIHSLGDIEQIRVYAMVRHGRKQSPPEYAERCRCEHWEVPLVEVRWRE